MYFVYVVDVVSVVYDVDIVDIIDIVNVVTVNLPGLHLNSYASHFAAGSSGFKAVVPSNTTCVKKGKKSVYMKLANKIGIKWYIKM